MKTWDYDVQRAMLQNLYQGGVCHVVIQLSAQMIAHRRDDSRIYRIPRGLPAR